ncbi:hypothetical protein Lal_00021870 [Lupinus albus]|nr:hypothetical protein Lal_00021870 [Lupinus albus]
MVRYRKTCTAKQIAMSQIFGDWEGSYKKLPLSHHEDGSSLIFDRVFWDFKPCIEGFGFCKAILQVIETFLTGKYSGTLLIESSQDDSRRIFPVVFVIFEGETKEVCEWFFYNVRTYVTPQSNICIISDRGTGLLGALRTELSQWYNAQSGYCIRHVASNFNKELKDTNLKEKNHRNGETCDHMMANLEECINGVLKGSKSFPITTLVTTTYHSLNSWFLHHRNETTTMIRACHIYCQELTKVINENNRKATCQLVHSFSWELGVSEVEVVGKDGSRHSRVYTVRLIQNW